MIFLAGAVFFAALATGAGGGAAAQHLLEGLPVADIEGVMRRDPFGNEFGELLELEKACGGVVPEVAFSQRAELHQLGVVCAQKAKIRGLHGDPGLSPSMIALFGGDWLIPRGHNSTPGAKKPTNFPPISAVMQRSARLQFLTTPGFHPFAFGHRAVVDAAPRVGGENGLGVRPQTIVRVRVNSPWLP